jgi:predicted nuclease of restriction endonuclease-like (RecB) superfamily
MLEDSKNYRSFLDSIKTRIQEARIKASLAVNKELVQLYWTIGKEIAEKQAKDGWGAGVIDRFRTNPAHQGEGIVQ